MHADSDTYTDDYPDAKPIFHTHQSSCYSYPYPHAHIASNIVPFPLNSYIDSDSHPDTDLNPISISKSEADLDSIPFTESYTSLNSTSY